MPLIVDRSVAVMSDFVCGANEKDFHLRGVNFGRDAREPELVADIRNVVKGDPSPDGKGTLEILRGIEVGHVFALGHALLESTWAQLISMRRSIAGPIEMGCYGIGVTRVVAAAIEQNHDEQGHHLAGAAGAVHGGHRACGLRPQRGGPRARPTGCTPSWPAPASRCCWTTGASGLA